jgi:hypothetical protein
MDLTVFIPTRGRIGLNKQITLREFRDKLPSVRPIIVCPAYEAPEHSKYHDYVWPCPVEGIGPTRQWIIEQSKTNGVLMLDDDLYFSMRENPFEPRPLIQCHDLGPLMQWVSDQLDRGYVHGGISARQGNQNILFPWTDCLRVNNAHLFNRDVYLREGIRFDRLPVMEDFDVTLGLLVRGYPNRVAYHYCWSQRGSGLSGGCSSYRTPEVQAEAAEKLHQLYPRFVKIVEKTAISGGSVFAGKPRTDVNIYWVKAWEARTPRDGQPEPFIGRQVPMKFPDEVE